MQFKFDDDGVVLSPSGERMVISTRPERAAMATGVIALIALAICVPASASTWPLYALAVLVSLLGDRAREARLRRLNREVAAHGHADIYAYAQAAIER